MFHRHEIGWCRATRALRKTSSTPARAGSLTDYKASNHVSYGQSCGREHQSTIVGLTLLRDLDPSEVSESCVLKENSPPFCR